MSVLDVLDMFKLASGVMDDPGILKDTVRNTSMDDKLKTLNNSEEIDGFKNVADTVLQAVKTGLPTASTSTNLKFLNPSVLAKILSGGSPADKRRVFVAWIKECPNLHSFSENQKGTVKEILQDFQFEEFDLDVLEDSGFFNDKELLEISRNMLRVKNEELKVCKDQLKAKNDVVVLMMKYKQKRKERNARLHANRKSKRNSNAKTDRSIS